MPKTNRPLTVVALVLSLAMGALEATVVSTAMPTVIGDLGGIEHYSWVFTAYLLASTVTVPLYGKLADLYGRKPILLFGIALFLVGSAASGASRTMTQLIAFRTAQGLGAGAMQPVALTVVGDIFDLEERARMQGVFGAAWGLSGLVGPMLGGVIVKYLSWRWVFYVNLPFGVAAAGLLVVALHERIEKRARSLDLGGAAILTAAIVALLFGASGGAGAKPALAAAAVLLVVFIAYERRVPEPVVPLDLFTRRVIAVSSLAGAIIGGAMIATLTYVPLFVQGVLGGTATEAGGAITPMVITWPIASALSGRLIPRAGFRFLVRVGLGVTAVAALALALPAAQTSGMWPLRLATGVFGIGMGFANTALLIAVQTSVSWKQRGIATASTMFFRTIGGTLAVGVMGGLLRSALEADPSIPAGAASQLLGPDRGRSLDQATVAHLAGALREGVGSIFRLIAGLAVVAFATSLLFPHVVTAPPDTPPPTPPSRPGA